MNGNYMTTRRREGAKRLLVCESASGLCGFAWQMLL